jgi:hypothetical protein
MNLNPNNHPVPELLETPTFVIRRQYQSDNHLDYEAVMDSKEVLREWSDSDWPEDDFSLEQNGEDIAGHIKNHQHHLDYGFSIFASDYSRLLGSLYLNPMEPLLENYPTDGETLAKLQAFDIRIEYWLRRGTSAEFEQQFVGEVRAWLKREWWFKNPVLGSRKGMVERRKLYSDLGMVEVAALLNKDKSRKFHFHSPE